MKINNINDLAKYYGSTVDTLKHDIYKYTDCGAWIHWDDSSFEIGSIVEGSDAEFSMKFKFPTESNNINDWLDELEKLTTEAWIEANGEFEDEYKDDLEILDLKF